MSNESDGGSEGCQKSRGEICQDFKKHFAVEQDFIVKYRRELHEHDDSSLVLPARVCRNTEIIMSPPQKKRIKDNVDLQMSL
jgi:hypothetical protein